MELGSFPQWECLFSMNPGKPTQVLPEPSKHPELPVPDASLLFAVTNYL